MSYSRKWPVVSALAVSMLLGAAVRAESPIRWEPLYEPGCGGAMVDLVISPMDSKRLLVSGDMLGIGLSTDGGDTWQSTFGLKAWECGSFTYHPTDPNTVWVGMVHGPAVSKDGGKTWTEKRNGMPAYRPVGHAAPIEKILFDPKNINRLLAISGSRRHWDLGKEPQAGGIWESTDGGENWKKLGTVTKDGYSTDANAKGENVWNADYVAGSDSTLLAVADNVGLLISTDSGRTWQPRKPQGVVGNIASIALHPSDPNIVWVATASTGEKGAEKRHAGSVFKSTDMGQTFTEVGEGLLKIETKEYNFTSHYEALAVSKSNPDVLYVDDGAWNRGIAYKSVDGGKSWKPVAAKYNMEQDNSHLKSLGVAIPKTAYYGGVAISHTAIDPKNPDVAYMINQEFILRTTDGGKTWTDATSTLVKEENGKTFWRGRGYSGLCSRNFRFNPYQQGQSILQGMDASRAWVSNDNLKSWTYPLTMPNAWFAGSDATFSKNGTIFVTSGQFCFWGIGRSTDGGNTWKLLSGAEHGLPKLSMSWSNEPQGIYVHPDTPNLVWAIVDRKLASSTDTGDHWSSRDLGSKLSWIAADSAHPDTFYVTAENGVYRTTDAGKEFKFIGGPKPSLRTITDSKGQLYVVSHEGKRGGLYRFANDTWTRLKDDIRIKDIAVDPKDPNRLLICTNQDPYNDVPNVTGTWISADAGQTWQQENQGQVMTRGYCVAMDPFSDTIIYGSFGRGFFKATWPRDYKPTGTSSYKSTPEDAAACNPEAKVVTADATPAGDRPALRNGSMTDGDKIPSNWTGKFGECNPSRDTVFFHSAPAALCVATVGEKSNGMAFQTLERTAGLKLKLSGWVQSEGDVKVNIAIQSFDEKYTKNKFEQIKYVQNHTDWESFSKEITVPTWAARSNIAVLVEGNGKAWLDDVELTVDGTPAAAPAEPAKADAPAEKSDKPADPLTSGPPAKAKPSEPGWGFYKQYPKAWQSMHQGFVARTKKADKEPIDIIFFGDSLTQGWNGDLWKQHYAPLHAVNYGIGGDSTRQVLWRIENGEVEGLKPKVVVLLIGTNNLYDDFNSGSNDDQIAEGIAKCVTTLRTKLPETKVLLLKLLPRQNDWFCNRIIKINAQLGKLDDGKDVRVLDMYDQFLESPGKVKANLYSGDKLHLAKPGYEVWQQTMQPLLDEMLK